MQCIIALCHFTAVVTADLCSSDTAGTGNGRRGVPGFILAKHQKNQRVKQLLRVILHVKAEADTAWRNISDPEALAAESQRYEDRVERKACWRYSYAWKW